MDCILAQGHITNYIYEITEETQKQNFEGNMTMRGITSCFRE